MLMQKLGSLLVLSTLSTDVLAQFGVFQCDLYKALATATNASIQAHYNTTILDVSYVAAGSNFSTPGSCQSIASSGAAMCRVQAVTKTSPSSSVHFEAWLPDEWTGRILALGNGGLEGCIDYSNLDYGTKFGFATVASDNGHDGSSGAVFLNQPEVLKDFAFRAVHTMAVIGKLIVKTYYGRPHSKAYYAGCSQGGRQGMHSALLYPEDFDGILAGAPAVDLNHLIGWSEMLRLAVGAPTASPVIPPESWPVISQEIMNQCDGLDGVVDGIITDPDACMFNPETLLCSGNSTSCLNITQIAALKNIYEPLLGTHGQLLFPRYDPGAESLGGWVVPFNGSIGQLSLDWWRYTIYNDTSYSFENFSVADIEFADTVNPGGIATWNGEFSAFRDRGGKILSYHGRQDELIPSGNSLRFYNLIRTTLSLSNLDDFYRLFLIPGMQHCSSGPGAWIIGQGVSAVNDAKHNVLLALVRWVEDGQGPDVIVGTSLTGARRTHCRYPHPSVFDGTKYVCYW